MDGESKYPDRYELHQTLCEFWQRGAIELFAREHGIFLTNANQNGIADFLSSLFFEYHQIEKFRRTALQLTGSSSVFGFRVKSEFANFSLVDTIDYRRNEVVDKSTNLKIKPIVRLQKENPEVYKGTAEYRLYKPGRVEFLQGTERSFDYYIKQLDESYWELLVDCQRSNDGRIMEEWVRRELPRGTSVENIDQDQLNTSQTIRFFDDLGSAASTNGWRLEQVKRIVLRRDTGDTATDSEEKVETDQNVLSGITQAFLEGNDLRDNPFVRQSEEGGYRFTAMTYEYENTTQPYVKEVRAEFKQRPKVFEVSLERYARRSGMSATKETTALADDERLNLLWNFWTKAKYVFDKLASENTQI